MDLTYRLLNVFTDGDDPFSGNSVCVFEDGSQLSTEQMQALTSQVNTESVFILPAEGSADGVRFFSPEKETGFAGSASLAGAYVLRDLLGGHGDVTLREVERGDVTVAQQGDLWVFEGRTTEIEPLSATPQILASLVGLPMEAIDGDVMTVAGGRSGIVLPVRNTDDVRNTRLDARLLHSYAMLLNTEPQVFVWATSEEYDETILSRMFFGPRGGVLEVAATGTGGANLGAWLAYHGQTGIHRRVIQGRPRGRRSFLDLTVDNDGKVFVGGQVNQVARGTFTI